MPASKKGLGRGFESLIPIDLLDESFDPTSTQDEQVSDLRQIKLSQIVPDPEQPRRTFDESGIEDLATSIKEHGVLQPIVVMPYEGGYQIVAGERRYRASKSIGLDKIPALVRTLSGQHKLELSLIENIQRRDLNILETATAYLKLRDQFNLSLEEIGKRVGNKSVSAVSNTLRLLKLPQVAKDALLEGKLREGQARPLIGLEEEVISTLLTDIIGEEWSARKIEQHITDLKKETKRPSTKASPTLTHEEEVGRIKTRLGADVSIRTNSKGAGQIVIKFGSESEFKRLQDLLGK